MLKNFTQAALLCVLAFFLFSCKKDSTDGANAGGTSFYSFEGAPSDCAGPVIAGIYGVGTALNATNTITLSVNVAVEGTYSMRTTSANGVYFSGSGVFTAIGSQKVVLTGVGTPVRSGSFSFVPATNNTCNFNVSFGSGGPSAVFTYAGAPGNCTAPIVNGTYSSGLSLGATNYVDLAVNVTTPGAYTIITNNTNGISFSGSGVFTASGAQVIRLIGSGTPATTGSFAYTPSNNGCSFSINVTPPAPPATFTYNGAPGNCTGPVINGTYTAGTALNGTNTIVLGVNVTVAGSYSVSTNSNNGVTFSGSGNFGGTGPNTITLTSNNTPSAAGAFTYTPTGGCSFDITYTGGGGGGGGTDYLKCTIDGVAKDFSTSLSGLLVSGAFDVSGDLGVASFSVSVVDNNGAAITVGTYSKATLTNLTRYCSASYLPDAGSPLNSWQPYLLNSNPFTVTIQTITANRVTGTFSGDIFDIMGGNKKTVTNGTFSVPY